MRRKIREGEERDVKLMTDRENENIIATALNCKNKTKTKITLHDPCHVSALSSEKCLRQILSVFLTGLGPALRTNTG